MSAATYPLSSFGRAGGSYLAPDLTVRGRIETSGSVEMDCEFHGDVLARQAYVGPNGRVRARISAEEATVSGEMTGIVTARHAFFRDGCHFRGEVEYESLGTEPNAGVDARLVPVLTGSSSIAIPSVRDIPVQPAALPSASAPVSASAPPRINLSMLAFLGGMIVAGVITGILVVNPTTRSWKDQLLEQVLQPRPDAVPPAPMAAAPAETPVASEEPRITPPPPPAIPPSLSKMLPTPVAQDPVPAPVEMLETRSATAAAPAMSAPAPAAPVIPDLSPTPPLPRHEPVDPPLAAPAVIAAPAEVTPAPVAAVQPAPAPIPAPALEPAAPLPVAATPAPAITPAPAAAPSPAIGTVPATGSAAPPLPGQALSAPPAKAATPAEPEKPLAAADATKDAKASIALPATPAPAQSPVPAASKKPKSPVLPAGARGALQEVCSWELKCDSDNQCVSVRSCKMQ